MLVMLSSRSSSSASTENAFGRFIFSGFGTALPVLAGARVASGVGRAPLVARRIGLSSGSSSRLGHCTPSPRRSPRTPNSLMTRSCAGRPLSDAPPSGLLRFALFLLGSGVVTLSPLVLMFTTLVVCPLLLSSGALRGVATSAGVWRSLRRAAEGRRGRRLIPTFLPAGFECHPIPSRRTRDLLEAALALVGVPSISGETSGRSVASPPWGAAPGRSSRDQARRTPSPTSSTASPTSSTRAGERLRGSSTASVPRQHAAAIASHHTTFARPSGKHLNAGSGVQPPRSRGFRGLSCSSILAASTPSGRHAVLAIRGLYEIAIPVKELSRAEAFYRDVLGLEVGLRDETRRWVFLRAGGIAGMVVLQECSGECPTLHFAFTVDHADLESGGSRPP